MNLFTKEISQKLQLQELQINAVLKLVLEGSTVPFIARYRKDMTQNLDEVQIQNIIDESNRLNELENRKEVILKSITSQGKMTENLAIKIEMATSLVELEDIYLPYKPKRKTKAQVAREQGLEPLGMLIFNQDNINPIEEATQYLNDTIISIEAAIQGACDIVTELIYEDSNVRNKLRNLFETKALVYSTVLDEHSEAAINFKDYFTFSELYSKIPSHRALAIIRGFMKGVLKMEIMPDLEEALLIIQNYFIKSNNETTSYLLKSVKDAYRRYLLPSLETEFRASLKSRADEEAITVFDENLRQLLLSSPLGNKRILAIDPGYKTGCKVVCLDELGMLKNTSIIYIHEKNYKLNEAEFKIKELIKKHTIEAIAVGNGTAGRETETFLRALNLELPIYLVNEDGASIYSASEVAREEFPNEDITVRGSVSIGRRLMDPLAELVKIDPKSIGVGQYQHDVNQQRLKEKLDQTVASCVNLVGVNMNTASKQLLSYVSGISPSIAENIINYRNDIGAFKNRTQLLNVPRLGNKTFEQCAGFLKIINGENPLDNSTVHPESYPIVEKISNDLQVLVSDLIGNKNLLQKVKIENYINDEIGIISIKDILKELEKPGVDPRSELTNFAFAPVYKIEDLSIGMILPGIVTNITRFGAFVDIGVKQDGLVHVSEITHKYIQDPNEALKLNQQVEVKVVELDIQRKRISLSIKQLHENNNKPIKKQVRIEAQKKENFEKGLEMLKMKFSK